MRLGLSLLHRPHNVRECLSEERWQKHTMCQRDLNWQTSLPAGKQNLQVQSLWSQESNPKLRSVFAIQIYSEAALQVKFKTNNKVLTSWMLFLDVRKTRDFSFLSCIHKQKTCTPSSALTQLLHKDYLFQLQLNLFNTDLLWAVAKALMETSLKQP